MLKLNLQYFGHQIGKHTVLQDRGTSTKGPLCLEKREGETMETVRNFIFLGSKTLQMVTAAMKLKDTCSLGEKL